MKTDKEIAMIAYKVLKLLRRLQTMSLKLKLIWPINILTFIGLVALCLAVCLHIRNSLYKMVDDRVDAVIQVLSNIEHDTLVQADVVSLTRMARGMVSEWDVRQVSFERADTSPLANVGGVNPGDEFETRVHDYRDREGRVIARATVKYSRELVRGLYWTIIGFFVFSLFLVQLALSLFLNFAIDRLIGPLGDSVGRIAESIGALSGLTLTVSESGETAETSSATVVSTVHQSVATLDQVSRMAEQTGTLTVAGESAMNSLSQKAWRTQATLANLSRAIRKIHKYQSRLQTFGQLTKQINERLGFINTIVFQTQLLSFNATIVAARAGQHGRGFAIVAKEIGKLAKDSGQAAAAIGEFLKETEEELSELVESFTDAITDGDAAAQTMLNGFAEMANEIGLLEAQIKQIRTMSVKQEAELNEVRSSLANLSDAAGAQKTIAEKSTSVSLVLKEEVQALSDIVEATEEIIIGRHPVLGVVPQSDELLEEADRAS